MSRFNPKVWRVGRAHPQRLVGGLERVVSPLRQDSSLATLSQACLPRCSRKQHADLAALISWWPSLTGTDEIRVCWKAATLVLEGLQSRVRRIGVTLLCEFIASVGKIASPQSSSFGNVFSTSLALGRLSTGLLELLQVLIVDFHCF